MAEETKTVEVKSAWLSKINWVSAITALVALAAAFGFVIPQEWVDTVLKLVAIVSPILTIGLRTFFTTTITPASAKKA